MYMYIYILYNYLHENLLLERFYGVKSVFMAFQNLLF